MGEEMLQSMFAVMKYDLTGMFNVYTKVCSGAARWSLFVNPIKHTINCHLFQK